MKKGNPESLANEEFSDRFLKDPLHVTCKCFLTNESSAIRLKPDFEMFVFIVRLFFEFRYPEVDDLMMPRF